MNIFEKMELEKAHFTKSELKIYQMIRDDLAAVLLCDSIIDYANLCGVSKSAVSRFSTKLGYSGFSQMKFELLNNAFSRSENKNEEAPYLRILNIYRNALDKLSETIREEQIDDCARKILNHRRVKIYGLEASGYTGNIFCSRLVKIGIDSCVYSDSYAIRYAAGFSRKDELHLFITIGFKNPVIDSAVEHLKEASADYLVLTSNPNPRTRIDAQNTILLPTIRGKDKDYYLADHPIYLAFLETVIEKISELKSR